VFLARPRRVVSVTVNPMAREYATVQIQDGVVFRVDTDAANGTPQAAQFDGFKRFPLVHALNKLDELGYTPLQGAVDHGQMHTAAANYTLLFVREK
jgi:hypothetical protein